MHLRFSLYKRSSDINTSPADMTNEEDNSVGGSPLLLLNEQEMIAKEMEGLRDIIERARNIVEEKNREDNEIRQREEK